MQGWIDKATGEVQLDFVAKFYFTATSLYKVRAAISVAVNHMKRRNPVCGQR